MRSSPKTLHLRTVLRSFALLYALAIGGTMNAATPLAGSTPDPADPAVCPITPFAASEPDYEYTETWHGVDGLWAGLDRSYQGRWYASTGGDDRMKVMWWREVRGSLTIEGKRLDADAPPLDAWIPDGYGETGYQLGALAFPTEGCWEVVGRVGEVEIRFVVFVHTAELDPYRSGQSHPTGDDVWAALRRSLLPDPPAAEIESCAPTRPDALPVYPAGAALDGRLHGALTKGWWAIAPDYQGPVLIRGHRLDGDGELRFPYDGSQTELRLDGPGGGKDPTVPNPDGSGNPAWRYFSLDTLVPASGCYAVQIDGWNFSALLIMPAEL
jgi:hypothetical protein